MEAKRAKYANEFEGVDEGSAKSAINNFIESLESVDYGSSGCFPMSTNAKYDTTFNTGIDYLKNTDIQSMIDLCNNCITQIIEQITLYKEKYQAYERYYTVYELAYEKYVKLYQAAMNTRKAIEDNPNQKNLVALPIPKAPAQDTLAEKEAELIELAKKIKSVTF